MLAEVKIADEGILLMIYAAMYLMVQRHGNDTDISAALRYERKYLQKLNSR